jgi:serine/threonine protein kinase/energy-coupling factor transporter ATP-binding protein EcfA2
MVLDATFPPDSRARGELILLLKVDVRKAFNRLAEMQVLDIENGSVIVRFRFVCEGNDPVEVGWLEAEYLRQVDDNESKLRQGEVTCRIDQKRTQTMTMQLGSNAGTQTCRPMYQVGDTIILAHVQEEKIECKVESLLGEGATATVFRVTTGFQSNNGDSRTPNGKMCALKVFKTESSFLDLSEEASLVLIANHPQSHKNVLRADFVFYEQRTNEMFFLMGLVDGNDLQTWMDDERLYDGTIEEQQQRLTAVAHQLVCAVQHIHKHGLLHQDIKPTNVLMTKAGKPILGDFGVASEGTMHNNRVEAMLRGATLVYASPHVRQIFFRAKALPENQRKVLIATNKITHLDDLWSMSATIFDTFAECGWRGGRSVAEVLLSQRSLINLTSDSKLLRVALPSGMIDVLQNCMGFGLATDALTINSAVELMSTAFEFSPSLTQDGLSGKQCANIRNSLAIALYDGGHHDQALAQLERATAADRNDARALNNLGVVQRARGKEKDAMRCFHDALNVEPDHQFATFNASMRGAIAIASGGGAQFDRTGAVGAVEDASCKVALVDVVSFAPQQQLEVYRQGNWQQVTTRSLVLASPLVLMTYRLPSTKSKDDIGVCYAANAHRLFVQHHGDWKMAYVRRNFRAEFDQTIKSARDARSKQEELEGVMDTLNDDAEQEVKNVWEAKQEEARRYLVKAHEYSLRAKRLRSRHLITIISEKQNGEREEVVLDLDQTNYAPAFFTSHSALVRAIRAYEIELTDKHAYIFDIFSGQKLSTRTQTAALQYHAVDRVAETLDRVEDVDSPTYQACRALQMQSSAKQERFDATMVLEETCADLVLILGPAASGKTTLLKSLIMLIVHRYGNLDLIPVLIPVIEVLPVLSECKRDQGASVVAAFMQHKYPQHAHLLMQMMHMRRVVFFVDGIDESGSSREAVQDFVQVELLEPGHKTVITSRRGGFSSDAFRQCQLIELLPLSAEQQSEMVHMRVANHMKAAQLMHELGGDAFKEIASNPLMLTMIISIYLRNNCKVDN